MPAPVASSSHPIYTRVQFHQCNQADNGFPRNNLTLRPCISLKVRSCLEKRRRKSLILLRCSVSSAISCIVIKSDRQSGKIPVLGESVQVDGRKGSFVVMHVDRNHGVAQLMERSGKHRLFDVPFASLRPLQRNLSQVIRRFLDAQDEVAKHKGRRDPDRT